MTLEEMKEERLNRGLTIDTASHAIGVSRETLRKVEEGYRPGPRLGKLIADFYGVRFTDLWPVEREETAA